jgi:hypothetical protein
MTYSSLSGTVATRYEVGDLVQYYEYVGRGVLQSDAPCSTPIGIVVKADDKLFKVQWTVPARGQIDTHLQPRPDSVGSSHLKLVSKAKAKQK